MVSSCIWVFFWYNYFWWTSLIYILIFILPVLSIFCQVTALNTKRLKETILACIISVIGSKILLILVYMVYCVMLRLLNMGYVEPSNGAGLLIMLIIFIQSISELIAIIISISMSRKCKIDKLIDRVGK